jgi:phenylalanyl-tRNA synthetase beta chain
VVSIDVPLAFLFHRLGKVLPETEITACLQKLGFSVVVNDGSLQLGVPFWRSTGDISLPEDIVEEVARLHGYDKFELLPLTVELHKAISQPLFALERNIKEYLAYSCGMQEVFSYPWVDDRYFAAAGINEQQALRLFAPPAPDQCRLSTSLVLQMQQVITINQRHFDNFRVFELNRTFAAKAVDLPAESGENLPAQAKMLVGVCAGQEAITVFLEAKGILENMSRAIQLQKPLSFHKPTDSITWADANAQLGIFVDEQQIGVLGLLSQKAMRLSGIKRVYAAVFELEVAFLNPNLSRQNKFSHLPEYPEVDFDLNLVFADTVKWSDIKQLSLESDKLVTNVGFVDEYRGKQIPDGKKSITFRITLGSPTATLVAAEIEAVTEKLIKNLVTRFEAELR